MNPEEIAANIVINDPDMLEDALRNTAELNGEDVSDDD